ncbi:hypothetical protein HW130_25100 [Streptomyces sp. PKU-EA00015]|uniref:hypothetical protein n=1 Tax=Streptomyces sp. PKU-EA00015 TaxID=2748326 RepID=UPI0015A26272|nr:hypothetical protein [Streptomyces sp. PKU-EA00015]NWF29493.1 hypothetical protein [Streptomyces sp. PKU-EA00015]
MAMIGEPVGALALDESVSVLASSSNTCSTLASDDWPQLLDRLALVVRLAGLNPAHLYVGMRRAVSRDDLIFALPQVKVVS